MRTLAIIALVALAGLAGCIQSEEPIDSNTTAEPEMVDEPEPAPELEPTPEVDPNSLPGTRFIAVGDQGTGKAEQYQVAAAMEQVCQLRGCHFAVGLGDNIYEIGTTSAYDEQFETKFEQPYTNFTIPFYMVQGNHDNSADPISDAFGIDAGIGHWYQTGDYEVEYHYRDDRASDKWQMPARYYDQAVGDVTLMAMDTNLLMYWGFGATLEAENAPAPGEQEAWFDEAVAAVETPWTIAIGHHPYLSNGEHGNAGDYEASMYGQARPSDSAPRPDPVAGAYVENFYETHVCGQVDFIITGHDHDLQWLKEHPDCPGTEQLVSGAGGKTRGPGLQNNPTHFEQFDTLGFLWVEVTSTTFTGVFYDVDQNLLFERTVSK